jgi:hypothetical protein
MANQLQSIRRNVGTVAHSSKINWGETYEVAIGNPREVKQIESICDGPGWYVWTGTWMGPYDTEHSADNAWILHVEEAKEQKAMVAAAA